jgi:hypothetical protein
MLYLYFIYFFDRIVQIILLSVKDIRYRYALHVLSCMKQITKGPDFASQNRVWS